MAEEEQEDGQQTMPSQQQDQRPGIEAEMTPRPVTDDATHLGSRKLEGKVAVITGGDSGIGRAVAVAYAREGADVCVMYLNEHEDARETARLVEAGGRRCVVMDGGRGAA